MQECTSFKHIDQNIHRYVPLNLCVKAAIGCILYYRTS